VAAALASVIACAPPPCVANEALAQLTLASAARQAAVLDAIVNGRPMGPVFVVVERGEIVGIDAATLRSWRVVPASDSTFLFEDRRYVALADLPDAKANVEQRNQRLLFELPPRRFASTDFRYGSSQGLELSPAAPAGLVNYTLFGYSSRHDSYASGFFEAGLSGSIGSLIASASANTAAPAGQTTHRIVRYDTTYRRDDPRGLLTLNLGDSFSFPGAWGRSVRFGGVQYGTNFTLQPDLITYPLQAVGGTAVVPSTVDVFVNGNRITSQAVPPGPFTLNDVPLVSGAGDVQVVVRDAFGQQQTVTQPFYASRRLLRAGLDEFQINAGAIRENYGLDSFDYGSGMAAGYWRRGLNDRFTLEGRAEADEAVRAGGVTADFAIGLLGTVTLGGVASSGDAGSGRQWIAGYEYLGRRFNFAARSTWASTDFRMLGDDGLAILQRQSFASAGTNLGPLGSVGVAWAGQRYRNSVPLDTVAVTYTATLVQKAFVTLSLSRSYSVIDQTSAFATITFPVDGRTSIGGEASTSRAAGRVETYGGWSVQRVLPTDEGFGYRLRSTSQRQVDAGVGYTWPYGTYTLEASRFKGESAARATASGGIGYVAGTAFASRPITESFGVVQVGDVEGVRVYHEGNPAGRTGEDGRIVLHRMIPWVPNRITIDERDLPMDLSLKHREMRVVPQYRSGTLVHYDAQRRTSVILEVYGPDQQHLPAGTEIALSDSPLQFVVGQYGEVFVPDLPPAARFTAHTPRGRCGFAVSLPERPNELMPKLGPFRCEVAP
jgi:outer membrane usher protein